MSKYLHLFNNENDYNTARNNNYIEPWVSATNTGNSYRTDYNKSEREKLLEMPLTFEIISDGSILWKAQNTAYTATIEYKKNDGEWTEITSNTSGVSISVVSGDTVQFRGDNTVYSSGVTYYNSFSGTTCQFNVKGNIMSLIDSTDFTTATTLVSGYTFGSLFKDCNYLINASKLLLPATTLTSYCYFAMFQNCINLIDSPYSIGTTDTTLQTCSCMGMFNGCTKLIKAPDLPAPILANQCYSNMFGSCSELNYIKCLATDISAFWCTNNWINGVSTTGTFVKPSSTDWSSKTGKSGIPSGWEVVNAS